MEINSIFIIFSVLIVGLKSESGENSIKQCKFGDKKCIVDVMNMFYKRSGDGIPEFDLVPTNPYKVSKIVVEKGKESPVNFKIQFNNANITGIHLFHTDQVIGFEKDPRHSKFELKGTVKVASIRGPYEMSGKFLLLPITGKGFGTLIFENVKLSANFKGQVQTREGRDFISLKEVKIKMEPEKFRMNFENLFNDKVLSDNMNAVLNENAGLVYKELQGSIEEVMGETLKTIFAPVCLKYAYTDLFIKED